MDLSLSKFQELVMEKGSLAYYGPQGPKELDTTLLSNWTELNWFFNKIKKLEHSLTSYAKINSKLIKDLNVRLGTLKLLGKYRQIPLWHKSQWSFFGTVSSVQFSRSVVSDSLWPPWTAACQASLSILNSQSLLKLMSMEKWYRLKFWGRGDQIILENPFEHSLVNGIRLLGIFPIIIIHLFS